MAEGKKTSLRLVISGLLFPIALILAIDYSMHGFPDLSMDNINPRIANSTLTAFILGSTFLLGNMYFYGESRDRPLAPLFAMVIAILVGFGTTIFFIEQGDILLEDNGSIIAQLVYNISHTIVSIFALILAFGIAIGILFSSLTHSKSKINEGKLSEEE
ncbi:MAG: hypothetical protein HON10_00425 [Euryarchaeota archaeon]|jgi:hypothetical protein|nr:hypothetical protein [Euryarchaeota archaeon]MBT7987448.1 hypothetical protein [Euryarchaeota archaeon]